MLMQIMLLWLFESFLFLPLLGNLCSLPPVSHRFAIPLSV